MSKKKSYMDTSNLINEGFFNYVGKLLRKRPKVAGKEKISLLNKLKLAIGVSGLNKASKNLDQELKDELGDYYPKGLDFEPFTPKDFIK